ncbi:cell division protein FtsL [Paenibacillus protaetiae]|uniref:Cell division protein FtsL n=1 Tax=Paenibacillus protaetiae TaxID=2509456 RepID=A0A4P6ES80_9BACL|nr:cell division protein FtsL [Paenibacillus protaetiae]QAY65416.1 cell division protein FtsL [Paenibacillus protaetiae]
MAYTTNGNLAMQPKKKPEQQPVYRETKKIVVKKNPLPTREKLLWLFTIVVLVVVAGTIIFRYAQIYNTNLEIKQLKNEYNAVNLDIKEMQKQVESLSDPDRITAIAKSQGMISSMDSEITVDPDKGGASAAATGSR